MAYRGLTAIGANYLATRLAQELPVEFTKVQIGAGTPVGNPSDVTNLQNYKLDAKILKKSQENNTVEITIQVVNDNIDQGFYLKEIGVFVNDDTEKLYWYCNEDNAQYIPAKTDSAIAFEIDIKMEVTNVESPILNWSGQGTWIDKEFLKNNTAKIKFKNKGQDVKEYSILGENIEVDLDTTDIIGTINNEITLNQAKGNGWYKVDNHWINNMYGYGFLYAYSHEQTTQQIFFSHRGGIAWRQDWNSNISAATWQKIGADADEVIAKIMGITYGGVLNNSNQKEKGKCYYDTANKKIFKCIKTTNVNNANAEYFYPISNNDISELQRKCLTSEILYQCYEYKAQSGKKLQFDESRANRMQQAVGWATFRRIVIKWGGGELNKSGECMYIINTPGHGSSEDFTFEHNGTTCTISWILHNSMRVIFEGKNANTSWVSLVEEIGRVDMDGAPTGYVGHITNV